MPFRNPFFFSKKAVEKFKRIREKAEDELENGPSLPPKVNNYHTAQKATYGSSKNVHTPVKEAVAGQPATISNFEVNKPTMAKSLNQQPVDSVKRREIQEVVPAVNGKAAPELVGKPKKPEPVDSDPPVLKKTEKKSAPKRSARKKS